VPIPARRNTASRQICRRAHPSAAAITRRGRAYHRAAPPLPPRPVLHGERVGVRGNPRVVLAAPPKSTNPTWTKCTARNPCPIAPAARSRASPRAIPAAAKSSSPPTRANPAPSSARRPAQAAAHRGIGVGGRRGEQRNFSLEF
jgi:hypothetical protein